MGKGNMVLSALYLLPLIFPILMHPSDIGVMVFHGSLGPILLAIAVVPVVLGVWGRMAAARGAAGNGKPSLGAMVLGVGVIMLAIFGPMAVDQVARYHRLSVLQREGRRAEADVRRLYVDGCGKRSCGLSVEYTYRVATPRGLKTWIGHDAIGEDRDPPSPPIVQARTTGRVPIAYDPGNPSVSGLNFDDGVFREDLGIAFRRMVGLLGFLLVLAALPPALIFLLDMRRQPPLSPA